MTATIKALASDSGPDFEAFVASFRQRIELLISEDLERLQQHAPSAKLAEAMAYSVLNGGKRVRALLVYAAAIAVGEPSALTDRVALALEYIHAYSLIHDDLPAMDDDELRRGKPTCHIAFDEATAILAGDALQTRAFEHLAESESPDNLLAILRTLAKASGAEGMVAGQSIDLDAVNQQLNLEQLKQMHNLKTGALIRASVDAGALSVGQVHDADLQALKRYAEAIGLAFQVQDDILDVTANTSILGKAQGADQALNKPTFVSLMGLDNAKTIADDLYQLALQATESLKGDTSYLQGLADYVVRRNY